MRICCVIASLGSGGAERVMMELCTGWIQRGYDVTLLTLSDGGDDFYRVPEGVARIALGLAGVSSSPMHAMRANVWRVASLRRALRDARPDAIVSFTDRTNVLTLLAARALQVPVVVSERIDPRRHNPGAAWRALRRATYPGAAAVVVQTERVREWAEGVVARERVAVIPNPQRAIAGTPAPVGTRAPRMVAMGRLVPQKGFDTLLRAFAHVSDSFPEWRLDIFGEGPDRDALEALATSLALGDRVLFAGRTVQGDAILREASVFVLSSRYEGFPNVLLEAMTAGCACVATDCDAGPAELLSPNTAGLLVPVDDVGALAESLRRVCSDTALRERLSVAAKEASARYRPEVVLDQWDSVLQRVTDARAVAA
ncbi:MAG: glycosyltransferase family 4 protein [Gemmatimonadaceae bacterium]|nr:glycosyltransferase family 4 protein [Gemmatimonadaceae bacterium]